MSKTIGVQLPTELIDRLDQFALSQKPGITRDEASTMLLDGALIEREFTAIEFRITSVGRAPFVKETGMAVWELITVARDFAYNSAAAATHLELPSTKVESALSYYQAHRSEIDQALKENDSSEERILKLFPNLDDAPVSSTGRERP